MWWLVTLSHGFDLSINPRPVTVALLFSGDEPSETRGVGCAIDLPGVRESLAQFVGEGIGNRSPDILTGFVVDVCVLLHVFHERSV